MTVVATQAPSNKTAARLVTQPGGPYQGRRPPVIAIVDRLVYRVVGVSALGAAYALACNLGALPMPGGVA